MSEKRTVSKKRAAVCKPDTKCAFVWVGQNLDGDLFGLVVECIEASLLRSSSQNLTKTMFGVILRDFILGNTWTLNRGLS